MAATERGAVSARTAPEYTSSVLKDFSSAKGNKDSYVQVKKRKNGQYVVVEKLPIHPRSVTRNHGLPSLQQALAQYDVKLNSIKPSWMPTAKVKTANLRRASDTYPVLPPIDLGFRDKAEPLVGSLLNVEHEPGGGKKTIQTQKLNWNATAKVGSLDNVGYKGTPRADTSQSDPMTSKRRMSSMLETSSRYSALAKSGALGPSLNYNGGGLDAIPRYRRYLNARPRVGSLDNITHIPGGGEIVIASHRNRWKSEAKIGSLDNAHHVPGGGDVSISNQRLAWQAKARVGSLDNITHVPRLNPIKIPRNRVSWDGRSRVGSLDNIHHQPGGGVVAIPNRRLRWNAQSKIDSRPPKRNSQGSSMESLNSCKET